MHFNHLEINIIQMWSKYCVNKTYFIKGASQFVPHQANIIVGGALVFKPAKNDMYQIYCKASMELSARLRCSVEAQ